ncbi:MAG: tetratricopeptide repeat protein [Planctomycetota bacterium]|jgi:tetratricopeptide (TPR) repeat protein
MNEGTVPEKIADTARTIPAMLADGKAGRNRILILAAALAVLILAAYWPALGGAYIADDIALVAQNPLIESFDNVPLLVSAIPKRPRIDPEAGILVDPGYRPVTTVSFMFDYMVAGRNTLFHHAVNLVLHFAAALMVFVLLFGLTRNFWAGAIASVIWAVHPLATEAVAPIHGRKEVLSAALFLAAFLLSLRYRRSGSFLLLIGALVTFTLGLYAKEIVVVLPFVLLAVWIALDREEKNPLETHNVALLIPMLILAITFGTIVVFVKNPSTTGDAAYPWWGGSFLVSAATMSRAVWQYIGLFLLPWKLTIDYSYNAFPVSSGIFSPWTTLPAVLGVLGFIVLTVWLFVRNRRAGWCLAFFWLLLLPVLQIVPQVERMAERFMYLPMIGLVGIIALGVSRLWRRAEARIPVLVVALIISGACAVRANIRARDYRNAAALWLAAAQANPSCIRAHYEAAVALNSTGRSVDALGHLKTTESLTKGVEWKKWMRRPWRATVEAHILRGRILAENKNYAEAAAAFRSCLAMSHLDTGETIGKSPAYAHVWFNLGLVLEKPGESEDAKEAFEKIYADFEQENVGVDIRFESFLALARLAESTVDKILHLRSAAATVESPVKARPAMLLAETEMRHTDREFAAKWYGAALEALSSDKPDPGGVTPPLTRQERKTFDRKARKALAEIAIESEPGKVPELLEPLRSTDPDDAEVLLLLGKAYISLGEKERAAAALKTISPAAPEYSEATRLLKSIYEE